MNGDRRDSVLTHRRTAQFLLFGCASLAVAALPIDTMTWPWLVALLTPAALIASLRITERWPFWRALCLTLLQLGACLTALHVEGPLPRPVALAATLLPPLAFVVVRRQETDRSLGLFLSLCVLLVGAILQPTSPPLLFSYVFVATAQLHCDARLRALELCATPDLLAPSGSRRALLFTLLLGGMCAVVVEAVDTTLERLPVLESLRATPAPNADTTKQRAPGLSDQFELGGDGVLSNLRGEHLVTVRSVDRNSVSRRLYLRSGFFQVPGLDSWQVGQLHRDRRDASTREWRLRRPVAGFAVQRVQISRTPAARNLVFVPPATHTILGIPDLVCDPVTEWFRQNQDGHLDDYEVRFAELDWEDPSGDVDLAWSQRGLLALPKDLDRTLFEPLLRGIDLDGDAVMKARAIAAMLQQRCRYERREPFGPHQSALLNFLHGERIGFCMHFASAAAILLRMAGVPCRIGVGLYGGEVGERGERRYGSQHAHAWVEIPIADRGFLVFDPTPPSARGTLPEQPALATNSGNEAPTASDSTRNGEGLWKFLQRTWPYALLSMLVLAPFVGRKRAVRIPAPSLDRAVRPARKLLATMLQSLGKRGYRRERNATLEQFARELQRAGAISPDIETALLAYQEVRFGGRTFDRERESRLEKGIAAAELLPVRAPAASAALSDES
ncbi:MAG: transglutaminase domain-containing protein [Planctomycetota bacterium]